MKRVLFLAAILSINLVSVKGHKGKTIDPCQVRFYDLGLTALNGCPAIYKKQKQLIIWWDNEWEKEVDGTGACGTQQKCTIQCGTGPDGSQTDTCGSDTYGTQKECWPCFLTPCGGKEPNEPGCGYQVAYIPVRDRTANKSTVQCVSGTPGCFAQQTTCGNGLYKSNRIVYTDSLCCN